jgi:hypothetical protein
MYRLKVTIIKNKKIYTPQIKRGANSEWQGINVHYLRKNDNGRIHKSIQNVTVSYNEDIYMTENIDSAKNALEFLKNNNNGFIDDEFIYL